MQRVQIRKAVGRATCGAILACGCAGWTQAQDAAPSPALTHRPDSELQASPEATIPLTVPAKTPIDVALDNEVRVRKAGQVIHGHVVNPLYAFDKLVIPAGTEVTGRITRLQGPSGKSRTLDALNADFTPASKIEITFDALVLPSGKNIAIHTKVAPEFRGK